MLRYGRAAALGILADRWLGEPPADLHPVAGFGTLMERVEEHTYRDGRAAGAAHALVGVGVAALAGRALPATSLATCVAVAGRSLGATAAAVGAALTAGDLDEGRRLLPALVGRDPAGLDDKEIARAVVESVAENTVDAVVAPALWAAAAGAPAVLAHRAVNTLDAMLGHRNERYARFGWASARLDDLAAYGPARATAALVAACRPRTTRAVWTAVRRDAPAHPSPNSGVAEAAFAAALGLRLGGESRYGDRVELRPPLGTGRPPGARDIAAAVRLSRDVSLALAGALFLAGAADRRRRRRP
ncbi:MAG: adenosylcobinamide-phosphate synthase CbiB [Acidimicrobiales bacterium]|nr:adenosylcobinamide-phosphate synthase CbiB [Acidimicrobiales bacterium]